MDLNIWHGCVLVFQATDNMKMTMTQATLERNAAVERMSSIKQDADRLEKDRDQVSSQCIPKRFAHLNQGPNLRLKWI